MVVFGNLMIAWLCNMDGDKIDWWFYGLFSCLCFAAATIIIMTLYLVKYSSKKKFYKFLSKYNFDIQKHYEGNKYLIDDRYEKPIICIDFTAKRFASNYLMSKIVPFRDIVSATIEVFDTNTYCKKSLKAYVSLVIMIKRGEPLDLFGLTAIKVPIEMEDYIEDLEIDDRFINSLINKYPELSEIVELKADIDKIVEINREDGIDYEAPTDEQWEEYFSDKTDNTLYWEK